MVSFTVVIPVFNRSSTVWPTLRSVQEQTFEDFECLVVDDGSEDCDELKMIVSKLDDHRFRYIYQSNGGGGAARNTGILAAKGEWISLLDSDDRFHTSKLAVIASSAHKDPSVQIWSHRALVDRGDGVSFIRPTKLPKDSDSIADLMFCYREFLQTSTLSVRTDWARRILFDASLRKAQDVDFMIRLERAGAKYRCLPDVLSLWNDRPAENRVGAPRRPSDVKRWYAQQRPFLSPKLRRAFEATYLSYEVAKETPFRAFFMILRSLAFGSIGARMAILSLLRAFLNQRIYRHILNYLVKGRSAKMPTFDVQEFEYSTSPEISKSK
ncbi:glycosyltransferase family 2 protein [Pannonibacter indicus]|uniref:Glycosyltransferase involved in cell wall bisynthesis n=1 Tax=Pannonibacter indicus TaxID=466044 RepID=A0A0K6HVF8_9HYPH|nr:glycosyltransferase family 2 protein [Pannonibacter indicus]CUA94880.1 Glycosyltransferase involved in cell wall bisynthesis [Pannonibacter indicus]